MKKILFLSLFIVNLAFGQSVTISPTQLNRNGGISTDISIVKNSGDFATISGFRSGGTTTSPTSTTNGMNLMQIGAGGYTGSFFFLGGLISFFATDPWTGTSRGTKMTFSTTNNGTNPLKERMVIDHDGKVGIGLVSPNQILDINGRMRIRHAIISDVDYSAGVWMSNSTNSLSDADGAFHGMKTNSETGFFIGGAWRFWVNSAGNGYLNGNLIQTSDRRLKKDFSSLNNSLSSIYSLNGYHFKWKEEARSKDLQTGLIAQEVQKIFPELVQTDEKGFLSVNYIGLVPHLIEAVKELRDENNSLKNKNQTLESRLDKIEAILTTIQPYTEILNSKK